MKVIVTGGAGFIGSHLCEELLKTKKVKKILILDNLTSGTKKNLFHVIKNKKISFIKQNICKINKIKKYFKDAQVVFHLAAQSNAMLSFKKPNEFILNNYLGTINILESMRHYNVKKIVYAASSSCYGNTKIIPTDEKANISNLSPYALSKNLSEKTIIYYSKMYKMKYISLRLFNVYGPRAQFNNQYSSVINIFLKQKSKNKSLSVVGNGKQTRDFVHVKDTVKAFKNAGLLGIDNKIYNIGSGKHKKIIDIAKLFWKKNSLYTKEEGRN